MTVLRTPKEILGVEYAHSTPGHAQGLCRHWRHLTPLSSSAPPQRLLEYYLSYISVISQLYLRLTSVSGSQLNVSLRISVKRQSQDLSYISVISQLLRFRRLGAGLLQGPATGSMRSTCSNAVRAGVLIRAVAGNRPRGRWVYILVTLCRFDSIWASGLYLGPFIPCERRLALMEIPGIQGRDIEAGF